MLWAEDSALAVTSPSEALRAARPHPFAAGRRCHRPDPHRQARNRGSVVAVVAEVATGLTGAVPGHAAPGTKNPTRSAALDGTGDVPARRVGADRAGRARRRRAVRASVAYLAELAAFARGLVERGRVCPRSPATNTRQSRSGVRWYRVPTSWP